MKRNYTYFYFVEYATSTGAEGRHGAFVDCDKAHKDARNILDMGDMLNVGVHVVRQTYTVCEECDTPEIYLVFSDDKYISSTADKAEAEDIARKHNADVYECVAGGRGEALNKTATKAWTDARKYEINL